VIQYKVYMDSTGTYKNTATVRGCYQESVPEYGVYAVENGDGNNGWTCLEDSDSATVTVKKKSSPTRPPVTPSDPKPPVIDIPDEPTPEGPAEPGIVIPDEEIPEGPALPQTGGGIDPAMLYGLGALLAGGGLGLRFRRNK
jgi:LPXTG-motif cell wall-anchored protein